MPSVGRRLIVRCDQPNCEHAAIIDPRKVFGSAHDWPTRGRSERFRCICGSRQSRVDYTRDYSRVVPLVLGALLLVAFGLIAFALLRPEASASDRKEAAALIAQMDAAEARDHQRRDVNEKAREGLL